GPAKTAVVASAFFGMLSGSAAANVVTTGSFTIPAMKKVGYRPEFAAGVEAVASTGGQLTPPIMGAAAFLMIEFVGVSYAEIITFAAIPAFLYFFAVFAMVDLEARRLGLRPHPDETLPKAGAVLRKRGYLILPVVVMLYFLFKGYTPTAAAFWSIATLAGLVFAIDPENRRKFGRVVYEALVDAPRMIAPITVACAIGGIIAGIIVMGGLGLRISSIILAVSAGIPILALFLTMVVAIVLGMGMPTSAAYIIMAALLAPGLANMGIDLIAAHMFIIFCAAMSGITPPVAISSFAAAAIAGTDPWRTSWIAIKLGLSVYIIPYMFVYGPSLLGFGPLPEIIGTVVTASLGIVALSIVGIGWFRVPLLWHERTIAFGAAVTMIEPGLVTDLIGFALSALFLALVLLRTRKLAAAPAPER
ncbi:MAG: TRAP transporter fused permease subunit, partial [Proteobacteria bacterium]|nr:TRAP transporter fused permease subunit [Pseudomonadota bacterium]